MIVSSMRVARATAAFACALLAGCGGGGGGGGDSPAPQNRAPTFGTVQFTTNEDTDLSAQVSATDADGDALTFTQTGDPAQGAITAFAASGSFTYRPNPDVSGTDSFAVSVADSQGHTVNASVTIQISATPDAPIAHNDLLSVNAAGLANLDVLANDTDVDGDTLTVSIESSAEVGTAAVNAGGSIAITGLPAGFRGVTRFKYRVTDPSNAFSVSTAVVFVDIEPFGVAFAGDQAADGKLEVFMTDLAAPPVRVTAATEGNLRLHNFVSSEDGSTIAYRRHDLLQALAPVDLSFVRTADPSTQVRIQLPVGMTLRLDNNGFDQYVVSPDGQWIAAIVVPAAGLQSVILIDVSDPTTIHTASRAGATFARQLQFSSDSQNLYFISLVPDDDIGASLYRASIDTPDESTLLSATPQTTITDQVLLYALSADQSKVLFHARRAGGDPNLYFLNPANPGNEIKLNHDLAPGEQLLGSTVFALGNSVGGSPDASRVAYTIQPTPGLETSYVAEVSATPNPRPIGSAGQRVQAIRPDNAAVLLESHAPEIFETLVDSAQQPELVLEGFSARYDSRGDAVLAQTFELIPPDNIEDYITLNAAVRPSFGTTQHVGTPGMGTPFVYLAASDRAIALLAEEPPAGNQPPTNIDYKIANAWAPDKLLDLADFLSPRAFKGLRLQVVGP